VNGKDANGWAPLMVTAAGKHMELAKLLLKEGAAIDATDNEGQTALMWAAWNGYGEMATFLMERGAAIDKKDNKGRTALMCAQQRSETGAEKILALAEDIADFSPALKRTIPAPRPLKAAKP
jgi:ankyrin repeat protein